MAAPAVLLSSERQDWRTPEWFLNLVRRVAPIYLDPATTPDNPTRAQCIYTEADNALARSWDVPGMVYANPPYGAHLSGAKVEPYKPILRKQRDKVTGIVTVEKIGFGVGWAVKMAEVEREALYLVPSRIETAWWGTLWEWCDFHLFWSSPEYGARVNFIDAVTGEPRSGGSTFPSSVFYRGPNLDRFIATFEAHGRMVPGARTQRTLIAKAIEAGWRP